MGRIVIATIGSLGDLHPFIAIGLALQRRGARVLLAVPEDHVAKCRAAGLAAEAILPSFEAIRHRTGLDAQAAVQRIMRDQGFLMDQVLLPSLADSAAALDGLLADGDLLVASQFVFAAPIVAEKRRIPRVNVVLQPMALLSRHDPPRTPEFRMLRGPAPGRVGLWWNGAAYRLLRTELRRRYAGRIDAVRAAHGLPPSRAAPLFDAGEGAAVTLCCYSPVFAPLPPDAPPGAEATGFALFDSETGAPEALDPALAAFLDAGPPPLVFTLGSFAVFAPGDFYRAAARAARRLGHRAVLLAGDGHEGLGGNGVFACRYAPHSRLFPRAAAIVHHGGAGTTGQALRAGKPQIVVPHMGDQYDNGRRLAALGIARVIPARRFTETRAAGTLAALLADARAGAEAARIGALVLAEGGAGTAARHIEAAWQLNPV